DVPVRHAATLIVPSDRIAIGGPKVKYRGIFINDEAPAFSGWAHEKFGGINHQVYERVFELLLRLKGNYLWPAMWGSAFADDNSGNIRRLPAPRERARPGGFGVYYHFDYVGGPRNYKWINTNPIARVWEQMNRAYRSGADRIWIVNVGDLKPMEFPIQFFL